MIVLSEQDAKSLTAELAFPERRSVSRRASDKANASMFTSLVLIAIVSLVVGYFAGKYAAHKQDAEYVKEALKK